jgi:hypothetical protein
MPIFRRRAYVGDLCRGLLLRIRERADGLAGTIGGLRRNVDLQWELWRSGIGCVPDSGYLQIVLVQSSRRREEKRYLRIRRQLGTILVGTCRIAFQHSLCNATKALRSRPEEMQLWWLVPVQQERVTTGKENGVSVSDPEAIELMLIFRRARWIPSTPQDLL